MNEPYSHELALQIRASYPIINIVSGEEDRALELVEALLNREDMRKTHRRFLVWSITRGVTDSSGKSVARENTNAPLAALAWFAKLAEPAVMLFKDFHPYLQERERDSALIIRLLRDLVPELKNSLKTIVWLSPVLHIPPELEKEVTVSDLPLPTEAEYRSVVDALVEQVKKNDKVVVDLDDTGKEQLVRACRGLTRTEAENALYKTVVNRRRLAGDDVTAILEEKEQIVRKSGILEFISTPESFETIGGLENLKNWLTLRNQAYSSAAVKYGLPMPRGVLLVGVPGCGKSLSAKAVASAWKMPLLKFDIGRVFGSLVGDSEKNMRRALKTAEDVAPSILWVDELEKGLSGMSGGGDGGVSTRVFGNLLTWMEEKKAPVFVVATANKVSDLPPELLRMGRFDEKFFVDLPSPRERGHILGIHLARRSRIPTDFDLRALAQATEGFSGAELEQVVIEALFQSFGTPARELRNEHLLAACRSVIPLSRSKAEEISAIRAWGMANCRLASLPDTETKASGCDDTTSRRGRVLDL